MQGLNYISEMNNRIPKLIEKYYGQMTGSLFNPVIVDGRYGFGDMAVAETWKCWRNFTRCYVVLHQWLSYCIGWMLCWVVVCAVVGK